MFEALEGCPHCLKTIFSTFLRGFRVPSRLCYNGLMPRNPDLSIRNGIEESGGTVSAPTQKPSGEALPIFNLKQRLLIFLATWVGYGLIALIGRTLRWEVVGLENWQSIFGNGHRALYTFWHRGIFSATWFWRRRGIVVITSRNFDGEYIARIIQLHGYGAARGSSSRGATRAFIELARHLQRGVDVAFTIDGPQGPRFVAKPGPVLLAKKTGHPIFCFHISPEKCFSFKKSWDQFQIPYPFSRMVILMAPPLYVPSDADGSEMERRHRMMQETLDRIRMEGDFWWEKGRAEARAAAGAESAR